MVENQNSNNKKKKNNIFIKTAIIGVVAGLIGGGVSYAAIDQINNANVNSGNAQTSISSNSAKTSKKSAKNSGAMTPAYNDVKGAVVSVINMKRQSSNDGDPLAGLFGFGGDDNNNAKKRQVTNL